MAEKGVLYTSAPSPDGREEKEMAVYRLLDSLGIAYTRTDHEPLMTIAQCGNVDKLLSVELCKNIFLCNAQKTLFYLLLMPGEKQFKTKDLCAQINSARLSFAPAEYMEKYLNILPGAVSIMGLMNDTAHNVRLLIDRDVYDGDFICCHPCVNTSSLKIAKDDIIGKFLTHTGHTPVVVDL